MELRIYDLKLKDVSLPVPETDYIIVWSQTFKRRIKFLQTHESESEFDNSSIDLQGVTLKTFQGIRDILNMFINEGPQEVKEYAKRFNIEDRGLEDMDYIIEGIKYLNIIISLSPNTLVEFADIAEDLFIQGLQSQ